MTREDLPSSDLAAVRVAVSPIDKFREYLSTRGMKLTTARSIIVEEVFSDHEHFDADQLAARLSQRQDGRRVSRPSVYRTLGYMEKAGLLRKVARSHDREIYERDYGYPQHDHLICSKCGTLIEFRNDAISDILEEAAVRHGFHMAGHRLEVYGRCAECSRPRHSRLDRI